METQLILKLHRDFESARRVAEDGSEFWLARDLQILYDYSEWRNFKAAVDRAKQACQNAGQSLENHFVDTTNMVELGSGGQRQVDDVVLSRYAAYLTAQNGDPSKPQIAFAQTYFAVRTREQEVIVQRLAELDRLSAREKLTASEKELSGLIGERLGNNTSFAIIRSKGDRALFGGKTTQDMKKALGVPDGRPLADFLPTITIKAKDFATEVTNFNVKKDDMKTEFSITQEHVKNNDEVRGLLKARGIIPEALPPAEDLKKVERRHASDGKKLSKPSGKPTLPPPDGLLQPPD